MKNFILFALISLGLISCTAMNSCGKKDNVSVNPPTTCDGSSCPAPPLPVQPQKLVGNGWSLELSNDWTNETLPEEHGGVEFIKSNKKLNEVLLLTRENFTGTTETFALSSLRDLKEQGITLKSAKEVVVNNDKLILIVSSSKVNTVYMWMGVKNNVAYSLACGGSSTESWHEDSCLDVASKFTLL